MASGLGATRGRALRGWLHGGANGASGAAGRAGARALSTLPPYLHETAIPTYHFQDSLPKLVRRVEGKEERRRRRAALEC
jgi:hypothetical protein